MYETPTLHVEFSGIKWNDDFYDWKDIDDIKSNHNQNSETVSFKYRDQYKEIDMTEFDMGRLELEMRLLSFKEMSLNEES